MRDSDQRTRWSRGSESDSYRSSSGLSHQSSRKLRQLLIDRTFGVYFFGKLGSLLAIWVTNITSVLIIFELTSSVLMVGLVSVLQFAPQIVFAPWIGALIDRVDRRIVVASGQLVSAAAMGTLAIWLAFVGVEGIPGLWPIILTCGLVGLGNAVTSPATQALLPALVERDDLFGAITLNSSVASITRAVGPAAGAALYVFAGAAVCYGFGAIGSLALVGAMLALRRRVARQPRLSSPPGPFGGFRYVRETPQLLVLLVCVGAVGFGVDLAVTLAPPLAAELGQNETFVGTLASAFGFGAIAAMAYSGPLDRRIGLGRVGVVGLGGMVAGYLVVFLASSPATSIAGMFVAGNGFLLSSSSLTSRIQHIVPDEYRGRVMALWSVAYFGSRPIAAAINGAVADQTSARMAVLVSIGVILAGAFVAGNSSISDRTDV